MNIPDYFSSITNEDIRWVKQHYKMPLTGAQIGTLAVQHCIERTHVKVPRMKQKQEELEKNPIYKYYKDYDKYDKEE